MPTERRAPPFIATGTFSAVIAVLSVLFMANYALLALGCWRPAIPSATP